MPGLNLTPGGSGVDLTAVETMVETVLVSEVGPLYARIADLEATAGGKFRGEWAELESVYGADLASQAGLPANFTRTFDKVDGPDTWARLPFRVPMASTPATGRPDSTYALALQTENAKPGVFNHLHFDTAPAGDVDAIRFKMAVDSAGPNGLVNLRILSGGTILWESNSSNDVPWEEMVFPITSGSTVTWEINGRSTLGGLWTNTIYLADLELLVAGDPYRFGQYVVRDGKMWRSVTDANVTEPGSDSSWIEVPVGAQGMTERIEALESRLPIYAEGSIPTDAVAPYLVIDPSVTPATLEYEDGA